MARILTRKPNFLRPLNKGHPLAPNELLMIFNQAPVANVDLVSGHLLTYSGSDGSLVTHEDGRILNVAYNAGARTFYTVPTITLTENVPWEVTIRAKADGGTAWAVYAGTLAANTDFLAFNSTSLTVRYTSTGNVNSDYSIPDPDLTMKTYSLVSDGAGSAACDVSLYIDGSLSSTISNLTAGLIIDVVLSGHTNNGLSFNGDISHFRVSSGLKYNASMIRKLHSNLYQVLQPYSDISYLPVAAAGGVTGKSNPFYGPLGGCLSGPLG